MIVQLQKKIRGFKSYVIIIIIIIIVIASQANPMCTRAPSSTTPFYAVPHPEIKQPELTAARTEKGTGGNEGMRHWTKLLDVQVL